jgi:hypothetical protein
MRLIRSGGVECSAKRAGRPMSVLCCLAACMSGCASSLPNVSLHGAGRAAIDGAEVVTYSAATRALFVACAGGIASAPLEPGGAIGTPRILELDPGAHAGEAWNAGWGVTHVACDRTGERLVACLVPADFARVPGLLAIIDARTDRVLEYVPVGFNPDACVFSPDGTAVIVAGEGQPLVEDGRLIADPPGSVSVVDLSGSVTRVVTMELTPDVPVTGPVRVSPGSAGLAADLEPEYVAVLGDRAFVTCQENNAVLEVNWRWSQIVELRALESLPLERAAGGIAGVKAMPMPDQIAAFESNGRLHLVMAGEGDTRGKSGSSQLGDVSTLGKLMPTTLGSPEADLQVCAFTSATAEFFALGSRSLRVLDWDRNRTLLDTGAAFDRAWVRSAGASDPALLDRDSARGSEPEGLALWRYRGATGAFVGLERASLIALVDLADQRTPTVLRAIHNAAAEGDVAPEGLLLLPAAHWGGDFDLLVVGFEVSGTLVSYRVEPAAH